MAPAVEEGGGVAQQHDDHDARRVDVGFAPMSVAALRRQMMYKVKKKGEERKRNGGAMGDDVVEDEYKDEENGFYSLCNERERVSRLVIALDAERNRIRELLESAKARAKEQNERGIDNDKQSLQSVGFGKTSEKEDNDKRYIEECIDKARSKTMEMESMVSSCSYFLPAYDSRSLQAVTSSTKKEVAALRAELAPRKKFKFKTQFEPTTDTQSDEMMVVRDELLARQGEKEMIDSLDDILAKEIMLTGHSGNDSNTLQDLENQEIVITKEKIGGSDNEYVLKNLQKCTVYITGVTAGLYLHRLVDCNIYAGPTSGAVHVEDASSCTFMLASHQLRIHCTKNSTFMLRVRSNPIIEHTSKVLVGEYAFSYEGVEEDLKLACLDDESMRVGGHEDKWSRVEDFGWVRVTKSPHWDIMERDSEKSVEAVHAPGECPASIGDLSLDDGERKNSITDNGSECSHQGELIQNGDDTSKVDNDEGESDDEL